MKFVNSLQDLLGYVLKTKIGQNTNEIGDIEKSNYS